MNDNNEPKVRRGEKLQLSAAAMNNIIDSAKAHKRARYNPSTSFNDIVPKSLIKSNNTILVRNASIYDISQSFHVMRLSIPVLNIVDDLHVTNSRIAFDGQIPTDVNDAIVILQTPLETLDIGKGVISGVTVVRVKIIDAAHEWANPTPGETKYLTSDVNGQARILVYSPPTDVEDLALGLDVAIVHLIGAVCCVEGGESGVSGSNGSGGSGGSTGSTGSGDGSNGSGGSGGSGSTPRGCCGSGGGSSGLGFDWISNICPIFENNGSGESGSGNRVLTGFIIERVDINGVKYCEPAAEGECCPAECLDEEGNPVSGEDDRLDPPGIYEFNAPCTGYFRIQCWAPGGGGQDWYPLSFDPDGGSGGSGGGGAYAEATVYLSIGELCQYQLGARGGPGTIATAGEPCWFKKFDESVYLVFAEGGKGGALGVGASGGLAANSIGDILNDGGDGVNTAEYPDAGGGGGGAGSNGPSGAGIGLPGAYPSGGAGGSTDGGKGGDGGILGGNGANGDEYGGGGGSGGCAEDGISGGLGGYGGKGRVRISWPVSV